MKSVIAKELDLYIQNRYGIMVESLSLNILQEFIEKNIKIFSFSNWQEKLEQTVLNNLINKITISETYFFRDKKQINFIKNDLFYKIRNNKKEILIWSMGASTGEEAYTLAIIINELNLKDDVKIKILGFDINTENIHKARTGIYSDWSFRGVNNIYLNKYFKKNGHNSFEIDEKIKKVVSFVHFNIAKDLFEPGISLKYGKPDYILCRNTLMYFKRNLIAPIIERMYELLNSNGVIIPGIQEVRLFKSSKTKYDYVDGTCIFLKRETVSLNSKITKEKKQIPGSRSTSETEFIKKYNDMKKKLVNNQKEPVSVGVGETKTVDMNSYLSMRKSPTVIIEKYTIESLLKNSLEFFEQQNFKIALEYCDQAIDLEKSNHLPFYIKSMICFEAGNIEQSFENIKKAAFLNPDSSLVNYYYSNVMIKMGYYDKAVIYLEKAKNLLKNSLSEESWKILDITKNDLDEYINMALQALGDKNR